MATITSATHHLRENADTTHETAQEWYDYYEECVTTENCGDVRIQSVQYEWLDSGVDFATEKLQQSEPRLLAWEAGALVARAEDVREAAEEIVELLDKAVAAYRCADLDAVIDSLEEASRVEGVHGDDPATRELKEKLLAIGKETEEGEENE